MYQKATNNWLKHWDFVLIDVVCVQIAFLIAYMIRHGMSNPYDVPVYRNMGIFIELADLVMLFLLDTYKNVLKRGYYQELLSTLRQMLAIELVSVLYLYSIQAGVAYSRSVFFLMGAIYLVLSYSIKLLRKKELKKKMRTGGERSLYVVTTTDQVSEVLRSLRDHNYSGYLIEGLILVEDKHIGEVYEGIRVVADLSTAADYLCGAWADEVFFSVPAEQEFPQQLMEDCLQMGISVHLNLGKISGAMGSKQLVGKVGDYRVLTTSINYATDRQVLIKRILDILVSLVGCFCTGLIFLVVAPMIYMQSPGPIFFTQERVGKNGKKFKMYKFRSMYLDAEERKQELMKQNQMQGGYMFKMDFDPRVIGNRILPNGTKKTGIGQFIRDTSLDEFPQFFNVLKGDMSIVGTRPPLVSEVSQYTLHHRARLAVMPGITGLWQVSGRSKITDFEEVVRLDTEYITNWSIGLDLKIFFKTIGVVLKREGSV